MSVNQLISSKLKPFELTLDPPGIKKRNPHQTAQFTQPKNFQRLCKPSDSQLSQGGFCSAVYARSYLERTAYLNLRRNLHSHTYLSLPDVLQNPELQTLEMIPLIRQYEGYIKRLVGPNGLPQILNGETSNPTILSMRDELLKITLDTEKPELFFRKYLEKIGALVVKLNDGKPTYISLFEVINTYEPPEIAPLVHQLHIFGKTILGPNEWTQVCNRQPDPENPLAASMLHNLLETESQIAIPRMLKLLNELSTLMQNGSNGKSAHNSLIKLINTPELQSPEMKPLVQEYHHIGTALLGSNLWSQVCKREVDPKNQIAANLQYNLTEAEYQCALPHLLVLLEEITNRCIDHFKDKRFDGLTPILFYPESIGNEEISKLSREMMNLATWIFGEKAVENLKENDEAEPATPLFEEFCQEILSASQEISRANVDLLCDEMEREEEPSSPPIDLEEKKS